MTFAVVHATDAPLLIRTERYQPNKNKGHHTPRKGAENKKGRSSTVEFGERPEQKKKKYFEVSPPVGFVE